MALVDSKTMRRLAYILAFVASLGLLVAPFTSAHAHINAAHSETVVHGWHSHDFDHHEAHSQHNDDSSNFNHVLDSSLLGDVSSAHVVQLDRGASNAVNTHRASFITPPGTKLSPPAQELSFLERPPPLYIPPDVRRVHLLPPLRGPPHITP